MAVKPDFRGIPVTVVGLGIEGIDLVRYLASQGALVTVSDARSSEALRDAIDAISGTDARLALDGNRADDLTSAECVFVSQGVPPELPALAAARERGVPISSMTKLFFERCPAPIAGITGSSGKTTTTALIGAMLAASGVNYVAGGNIGVGLLGLLDEIEDETRVVVELSHTQLETLDESPRIACVTNVTPNHLDRYPWDAYIGLKRRVFEFQDGDDLAIFNLDDDVCAAFSREAPARVAGTSLAGPLPADLLDGVTLDGDAIVRRDGGESTELMRRDEIALRGEHNVANVLSALAVASQLGMSDHDAAEAVRSFSGVPHRLETVAVLGAAGGAGGAGGVEYVNDSIATTPERTLAGLRSFDQRVVLLLGGRDKQLPLSALATEAARRCRAVITFGEASELFAAAVRDAVPHAAPGASSGDGPTIEQVEDVEAATAAAAAHARPGDVVLFAPAGTSFDAYPNFERRGEDFRRAVLALERGG